MISAFNAVGALVVSLGITGSLALSLISTATETRKAEQTRQMLLSAAENYSEKGVLMQPDPAASSLIRFSGSLTPRVLKDAWGRDAYVIPTCWAPYARYFTSGSQVVFNLVSLGPNPLPADVEKVRSALFNANGTFNLNKVSNACSGPITGLPSAGSTGVFIETITQEKLWAMQANAGLGKTAHGGGDANNASSQRSSSVKGRMDGEVRAFEGDKSLHYWSAASKSWLPVKADPTSPLGSAPRGQVFVPETVIADGSKVKAFLISAGEVAVLKNTGASLDTQTSSLLLGGAATPQPFANHAVKLALADSAEPVHITPALVTYDEAASICAQMGPGGTLLQADQLEALKSRTGQTNFGGYVPAVESLTNRPGSPCKGTQSGLNLCAVTLDDPESPQSLRGTSEERTHDLGTGSKKQVLWDLGGNLAEWVWAGPGGLASGEQAMVRGGGYFERWAAGTGLTGEILGATSAVAVSPMSRAGFRCTFRVD